MLHSFDGPLTDRALAMAAVTSMHHPGAESPIDLAALFSPAEKIAEWISQARTPQQRQIRRTAVALCAPVAREPRDLLSLAREMAGWLERETETRF